MENINNKLLNIIINIKNHIDKLYSDNMIDTISKVSYTQKLLEISNNITNKTDKTELDKQISIIKSIILNNIGYPSIIKLVSLYNNFIINTTIQELLQEIDPIFIPTFIKEDNISNIHQDTYIFDKSIKDKYDILELKIQLTIFDKFNINKCLIIIGYFINDNILLVNKTCNNNFKLYFKNISSIYIKIKDIDLNFVKKFIKYDYIGNVYSINTNDYINYINNSYNKYKELCKLNFLSIVSKYISDNITLDVKNIYYVIILLLLGNENSINMAHLLLDITKEKNKIIIYNTIINRLPFNLLIKIKQKTTNNDSIELTNNIDYKKILLINTNIPLIAKNYALEKIEEMKLFNNDYYKQLTFVKTIINYPWVSNKDDNDFDILYNQSSENIKKYLLSISYNLNNLSYGHEIAKKYLLQIICKWLFNPNCGGYSFGFVGPPGIGKTLLAKSISNALNIPFAEITLGGQNDGELLQGHSYTYSGSQPGLIIKKMIEMGRTRGILYFDELDKTCSKHGILNEITSILIHLTDPNMNKSFQDRFFQGIDFPIDKIIIIFSYNDPTMIDPILLDRLIQIEIAPFTIIDKINNLQKFIIPEILKSFNITHNWIIFKDNILEYIIKNYTNESGVRTIKRKIEQIYLSLNLDKYINNMNDDIILNIEIIHKILGNATITSPNTHNNNLVGVINALYVSQYDEGGILPIQITNNYIMSNNFDIKITGKQGDIMKESIYCAYNIAISYIIKNLNKYSFINNLDEYISSQFKNGFHVHTPSLSISKNGSSAGCAYTCAFISKILNIPILNNIAISGEIDLIGNISKIGGLLYKLFGAKKANINIVYIPQNNYNDYLDIINKYPNLIDDNFNIKFINNIDEIINNILVN
jgi:ATP-dependent Lon protease